MYLEKYPLVSFILYGLILIFIVRNLKKHIERVRKGEDSDFVQFLLIMLIIISIYEFFNKSKEVVESGKNVVDKIEKTVHKKNNKNDKN
jgi:hypothetical protein